MVRGLSSLLTLTLPPEYHAPETAEDVVRARRMASKALNRFKARLRRRGLLGDDVWVEEAHRDGTPHLHVAFNDSAVRSAFGNDWAKVREYLQDVAYDSGFGFIDWNVGKGRNPHALAAELVKYLGKTFGSAKGSPPWRQVLGCTVDAYFQKPRFHRWGGSRAASRIVSEALHGPPKTPGEWELVARTRRVDTGRCPMCGQRIRAGCWHQKTMPRIVDELNVRWEPWSPGRSRAIVPECTFHFPDPSLPFSCHHTRATDAQLACFCQPPWLFEYVVVPRHRPFEDVDVQARDRELAFRNAVETGMSLGDADRLASDASLPSVPPIVLDVGIVCMCRFCLAAGAGCRTCPRCGPGARATSSAMGDVGHG